MLVSVGRLWIRKLPATLSCAETVRVYFPRISPDEVSVSISQKWQRRQVRLVAIVPDLIALTVYLVIY